MIQNSNERKPTRLLQITLSARPVCGSVEIQRGVWSMDVRCQSRKFDC
jgi:hypothetical protein